jgi:hypothetical protein
MHQRPDYSSQILQALKRCDRVESYTILIGLNPEESVVDEMLRVCNAIDFGASHAVFLREQDLGCNLNKLLILDEAFRNFDYVIHIDDDIPLAPDTLCYFEWARQFGRDSQNFTVGCWRHSMGWLPDRPEPKPVGEDGRVGRAKYFTCYGWATWHDRWDKIRTSWPATYGEPFYDGQMAFCSRGDRYELRPYISRSIHIGEKKGMHCTQKKVFPYWAGCENFIRPGCFTLDGIDDKRQL